MLLKEKRKHSRMPVSYEVFVTREGHLSTGRCRDISPAGIGLFTNETLNTGQPVSVVVVPADGMLNLELKGVIRYEVPNPKDSAGMPRFLAGLELSEEDQEFLPYLEIQGKVKKYSASHTISINASAAQCYAMICDFEHYPDWTPVLKSGRVLSRYPDSRAKQVEFKASAVIRNVTYILEYSYDDKNYCISWVNAGGDFLSITGRYFFKPVSDRSAVAIYDLDLKFDFNMPNRIVRYFSSIAMRKSMKEFRAYVEKKVN